VAKPLWDLITKYYWNRPTNLLSWIRLCVKGYRGYFDQVHTVSLPSINFFQLVGRNLKLTFCLYGLSAMKTLFWSGNPKVSLRNSAKANTCSIRSTACFSHMMFRSSFLGTVQLSNHNWKGTCNFKQNFLWQLFQMTLAMIRFLQTREYCFNAVMQLKIEPAVLCKRVAKRFSFVYTVLGFVLLS